MICVNFSYGEQNCLSEFLKTPHTINVNQYKSLPFCSEIRKKFFLPII
jgi:hypothetical protein